MYKRLIALMVLVAALALMAGGMTGCSKKKKASPPPPPARTTETKPAPKPEPTKPPERKVDEGVPANLRFDTVYFDFDKSDIRGDMRGIMNQNAQLLSKYPSVRIRIEGHCDERGTNEYNLALGQRRADSARQYLLDYGIAASRISTISYGEERPAVQGHNEAAWSKNRRCEFVITAK